MLRNITIALVSTLLLGGLTAVASAQSGWGGYGHGFSHGHAGNPHVDLNIHVPRLGIDIHSGGHGYGHGHAPGYYAPPQYGGAHGHNSWGGYAPVVPHVDHFPRHGGHGGIGQYGGYGRNGWHGGYNHMQRYQSGHGW